MMPTQPPPVCTNNRHSSPTVPEEPRHSGVHCGRGKLVSMHYADDAIITIKQNKCFKEVIKELTEFEQAGGAQANYTKTKELWGGAWKNRTDPPPPPP